MCHRRHRLRQIAMCKFYKTVRVETSKVPDFIRHKLENWNNSTSSIYITFYCFRSCVWNKFNWHKSLQVISGNYSCLLFQWQEFQIPKKDPVIFLSITWIAAKLNLQEKLRFWWWIRINPIWLKLSCNLGMRSTYWSNSKRIVGESSNSKTRYFFLSKSCKS